MSAVFNIQIKGDASGAASAAQQVGRDLDKVKQKALDVNGALRSIFGIYALKELVTGISSLANSYQATENKIRTVATSQSNLNGIMGATYKIAQDTRTSWDSTVIMYQRLALNSKTLGASQKEMLDFTKRLNEEVIVSGATSKEASSGIIQLAQGMAAGRLHGQDLRAVMEDLPGVVDVIAKHFHTTRGALYQMGAQGTITSQEIMKAFQEAGADIDKNFNKTVPTMAQGLELVKNAAEKFFGEAGTGSGVLATLASVLKFVADHFDVIGKVILGVVQALGGLFIIFKIIQAFKALALVIETNPFTVLVTAVVALVLLLRQFGDQINVAGTAGAHLSDVFEVLWRHIKDIADAIWSLVKDAWSALTEAFDGGIKTDGIELSLKNATLFVGAFVGAADGLFKFLYHSAITVFGGLPILVGDVFMKVMIAFAQGIQFMINKLVDGINFLSDTLFGTFNMMEAKTQGEAKGLSGAALKDYIEKNAFTSGPHVGHLTEDFSKDNPLDGAGKAIIAKFKEDWKADLTDTIPATLDAITGFWDEVGQNAKKKKPRDGIIDPLHGLPAPPQPTAAQLAAWQKLINEIDALIKKGTPYEAAMQKIRDATKILSQPGAGLIATFLFGTSTGAILDGIKARLKPVTDMVDEFIRKTIEKTSAMKGSREEEELTLAVEEELEKNRVNGKEATVAQANEIRNVIALAQDRNRVWREEQKILDEIQGPEKQYTLSLRAIQKALDDQTISQHQANLAREQAARTLLNSAAANDMSLSQITGLTQQSVDPDALTHGFDQGLNHVMQSMLDVSKTVSDAMQQTFSSLEKFIIGAAETGKFSWNDLGNSIIEVLNRVAMKIIETWLLTTLLNAFSGGTSGAVGAVVAAANANSAGPQGANPGVDGPIISPHGYASGGSYVLPGNGGLDSRSVMFRLTPGERVDFTPPGRTVDTRGGTTLGPRGRNNESGTKVVMIDGRSIVSALGSSEAERLILNVLVKNKDKFK